MNGLLVRLAGVGQGDAFRKHNTDRNLIFRQLSRQISHSFRLGPVRHRHGRRHLSLRRMRNAHHRRSRHAGDRKLGFLNVTGGQIHAVADDDLFDTARDVQNAVPIHPGPHQRPPRSEGRSQPKPSPGTGWHSPGSGSRTAAPDRKCGTEAKCPEPGLPVGNPRKQRHPPDC